MAIIPVPTTRISGLLARQRLTAQLQGDQLEIFRLQNQVSTGRRISLPSEDAPAAQRAASLQRLLERKTALRSSVESGQQFLAASDSALKEVASKLGDIRGAVLGVAGTTSSQAERDQVVNEINETISSLIGTANRRYLGRYLFAGSQTNVLPYSFDGNNVHYAGNGKSVDNYTDIGVLFSTNAPGQDVFGAISSPVLGGANLNPQTTADTPLSLLRGGRGISAGGAIQVSDGTSAVVVDLSRAVTLGDVARLIEENAPPGRQVTATITGSGLTLQLDASGGGNLTVAEVGSGSTASELGILNTVGAGTSPLVGGDLDPTLRLTTPLGDLLGAKASARLVSGGGNNDLVIQAEVNGAQYNGVTVQLVDDEPLAATAGIAAGSEYAQFDPAARAARAAVRFSGAGNDLLLTATAAGTSANNVQIVIAGATGLGNAANASYNSSSKTLTITVDDAGATTVDAVIDAVATTGTFTAAPDSSVESSYNGAALISAADIGAVSGNTGNSGGAANTLYVFIDPGSSTASGVAAAINAQGAFHAELDAQDTTAAALAGTGPVELAATGVTAGGAGQVLDLASGVRIVNGGQTHVVNFAGAETVEDLLNVLNDPDLGMYAEINAAGTGIDVHTRLSGSDFQIGENGGLTATQLGLRSFTGQTELTALNLGLGVPTKYSTYDQEPVPPPASYPDFTIVAANGSGGTVDLTVDVHAATTVQDVINLINNHPANNSGGVAIQARLAPVGNGIQIVDAGGRPVALRAEPESEAARYLGLLPPGSASTTSSTGTITGTDQHFLESDSVFTTLLRLRDALADGDLGAISRETASIDVDIDRVTFAQAEIGARERALGISSQVLEDEDVQLQAALSSEIDVDLVEAISNLTARQVSLQASLQAVANILQLSLLDFI